MDHDLICPECGSQNILFSRSGRTCRDCGSEDFVVFADTGFARELCDDDEYLPTLSTVSHVQKGAPGWRAQIYMNKVPSKEIVQYNAFCEYQTNCSQNGFCEAICTRAKEIFHLYITSPRYTQVRVPTTVWNRAAILYIALNEAHVCRKYSDIATIYNTTAAGVAAGVRNVCDIVFPDKTLMWFTHEHFVARFCAVLNVPETVEKAALHLLTYAKVLPNQPSTIAAGCIYYVCTRTAQPVTKDDICTATKLTKSTLAAIYKRIVEVVI